MRVAVVQLAYTDAESMTDRIHRAASLVESQTGADLVVLPELWSAGGFDYEAWPERAQSIDGPVAEAMAEAAVNLGAVVHAGSVIEKPGDEKGPEGRGLWNTSLVFDRDGDLAGTYRKIHRFGFGGGEPKQLEAGEDVVVLDLPLESAQSNAVCDPADPAACAVASQGEWAMGVETAGVSLDEATGSGDDAGPVVNASSTLTKVGLATCYDLRFPELFRALVDAGAEVVIVPAAWPAARVAAWRTLLQARAIENQVFVIACNTAGTHAGTEMGGNSLVVSPTGEILGEAARGERVLTVDVDLDDVAAARKAFPVLADRRL